MSTAVSDVVYRPRRSAFSWLLEREIRRFLNIWRYSLIGPVLSTLLFVIVFGSALGHHIDRIDGVAYGRFILPGLVAQTMLNVGFFNGTTSLFEARRDRYINDVFASPLRWWEINAALVGGGFVRSVIVGMVTLVLAAPLVGGIGIARPGVLIVGTLGVLLVSAQVGVVAGALAKSLDHVYSMESILLLPLGFVGGVFYSVQGLPRPWSILSHLDPVFWLVQVERLGLVGHADTGPVITLGVVWALAIALSIWSGAIFATNRLKP